MQTLAAIAKSFVYATRGIVKVFQEERNFRIQAWTGAAVVVLMFTLDLSVSEKALLSLAIAFVLVLELLNSVLERVVDILKPRIHHYVEDVKDMMAGAVLVASVAAAFIGFLVFWPHLFPSV
ncbi:MAG: diacylglycerol kinase, diacylglycerol kinase [Candidatus Parcubacteria bacterium]|jgi:diacylglycerol kinase